MAVRVTADDTSEADYPNANAADVKDGHLYVTSLSGGYHTLVALYAPGRWASAVVVE